MNTKVIPRIDRTGFCHSDSNNYTVSPDQIPAWVHLRPPKLTIRRFQNVDLSLIDPASPSLSWVPRTNSGTS